MTDAVIIAAIGGVVSLASLAMTLLIKQAQSKLNTNQTNLEKKQSVLHEQINGHMSKLLEVTAEAKKAEGKVEGIEQNKLEQEPIQAKNIIDAEARGNVAGRAELKDESKPIKPK